MAASRMPLFSQKSSRPAEREKYPFVFDALAEAKQSSAYVSGSKVHILPVLFLSVLYF
jgi:hypothetical protein